MGMRRPALLLMVLPLMASAAPCAYAYSLSGDQFVEMMAHPEPLSPAHYVDREKAYSYLDGAKDATAGTNWCPPKPRKTFELAYDAADYIKTLSPTVRKGNAATLLLAYLSTRYPCQNGARR